MRTRHRQALLVVLLASALAPGVDLLASTFARSNLEGLVRTNSTVVVAEVLGADSFWNEDADFILTQVRLRVFEAVKGSDHDTEMVVTLPGGTIGDLSMILVGGARLEAGSSYLLFIGEEDLPGATGVNTIRDHSQGVFRIVTSRGRLRAVSQANEVHLLADASGRTLPPGGADGFELDALLQTLRTLSQDSADSTSQEGTR